MAMHRYSGLAFRCFEVGYMRGIEAVRAGADTEAVRQAMAPWLEGFIANEFKNLYRERNGKSRQDYAVALPPVAGGEPTEPVTAEGPAPKGKPGRKAKAVKAKVVEPTEPTPPQGPKGKPGRKAKATKAPAEPRGLARTRLLESRPRVAKVAKRGKGKANATVENTSGIAMCSEVHQGFTAPHPVSIHEPEPIETQVYPADATEKVSPAEAVEMVGFGPEIPAPVAADDSEAAAS